MYLVGKVWVDVHLPLGGKWGLTAKLNGRAKRQIKIERVILD
jgi:hypothetical protein